MVLGRTAACVIVCVAAVAAPAARAADNREAIAGARLALHRYFDLMEGGQVDAAISYCHATDGGEAALAAALSKVWCTQGQSARAVAYRFGEEAVQQTVGRPTVVRQITDCPATVDGDGVLLQIERTVKFRMVKVGSEWKLSMRHLAQEFGGDDPAALSRGLLQVAKILQGVADGVPKGKFKDAAALRRALDAVGYNVDQTRPSRKR